MFVGPPQSSSKLCVPEYWPENFLAEFVATSLTAESTGKFFPGNAVLLAQCCRGTGPKQPLRV